MGSVCWGTGLHGVKPVFTGRCGKGLASAVGMALLVLPWIHTWTAGPVPNAWPWMVAAACALLWWLLLLVCKPSRQTVAAWVVAAWLLAACFSAGVGLLQYFDAASAWSSWISQTENPGEAFGNLRQRNQFATLTSIGLAALLGWAGMAQSRYRSLSSQNAEGEKQEEKQQKKQGRMAFALAAGVLLLLLALGNAASSSRTGMLQWLLLPALAWWWFWAAARASTQATFAPDMVHPPCRQHQQSAALCTAWLATAALLAYGLAVLVLPHLLAWVTGTDADGLWGRLGERAGCSSRLILWANVLELIGQKPWLGWGWGQLDYAHFIHLYEGPRFCEILDNAHNLPLHLAVELGLPLAGLLCGGAVWLIVRCKPWQGADPARRMAWLVLAVIGLHSLLEYPLWYGPFQLATALAVLMLWQTRPAGNPGEKTAENTAFYKQKVPQTQQIPARAAMILIAKGIFCLAALVALGYAAWDYQRISQLYLPPEQRQNALRENTLEKVRNSWLFADTVAFAELSTTPLTPKNAAQLHQLAVRLLAYSPEAKVVEKAIESAVILGQNNTALFYLQRFKAAYPAAYAQWSANLKQASR